MDRDPMFSKASPWDLLFVLAGAVIVFGLLSASKCDAEEAKPYDCDHPVAGFDGCPAAAWSGYAGSSTLFKPGTNRTANLFSRLQGDLITGIGKLHFVGRVDVSAAPDGGAKPDVTNPDSFQTVEARGGFYYPLSRSVSFMCVGGFSMPLVANSTAEVVTRYPVMAGCGPLIGKPRGRTWLWVGGGIDQAAGKGFKALIGTQVRLGGNTFVFVEGSIGGTGSYMRPATGLGTGR